MSGAPTQQQRSLTFPAGLVYTFSFSSVNVFSDYWLSSAMRCSDESSHLPGQCCSWVTVWWNLLAVVCVVLYLMVSPFALNHAGTTTILTRMGTSICVTSWPAHLCDCLPSVHLVGSWMRLLSYSSLHHRVDHSRFILMGKKCCATDVLNRFTINFFPLFQVLSLKS